MPLARLRRVLLLIPATAAIACGGGTSAPAPAPVPVRTAPTPTPVPIPVEAPVIAERPAPTRGLPAIPETDGPLAIKVVYPQPNQTITSRDSNFIFGSIGSGRATLTVNGVPARVYPNGAFMVFLQNPSASAPRYDLVATRGADTARAIQEIKYPTVATREPPAGTPRRPEGARDSIAAIHARIDSLRTAMNRNEPIGVVQLGSATANDTDVAIIGRPIPGGTYKWFFTPGTIVSLMSRSGGFARVRLDNELDVWVDSSDARELPAGTRVPGHQLSNMRVRASAQGADVIIPVGARIPFFAEEGDRSISLTLYGVRGNTDVVNYASADTMVRTVEWSQLHADEARVTINLRSAPYGYLVLWENNNLIVKLRGHPRIFPDRPLAGLTIAVDPGHPPIGATGPTGLWEPQATLPIGERLQRILTERGAHVIMTRTTDAPVPLGDRPIIARKANVNAFVSIHLNAYPDGVNPFLNAGSGTYFFRTHSEPLAREVQRHMVEQLGLPDLGINYDNLAVVRGTWYPAVLCEGAFVILPDQEAALRTPEFQERYALGVANGIEAYFRGPSAR